MFLLSQTIKLSSRGGEQIQREPALECNYSFCSGLLLLQLSWPRVICCDLQMLMEETGLDVENIQGDDVLIEMEVTCRGGLGWFVGFFFLQF